jgi:hypothetical protein
MGKIQVAWRCGRFRLGAAFDLMETVQDSIQMHTAKLERLLDGLMHH